MTIYLKIVDTTFKLPNRIIIGRGAPFTQFSDDRNIARAHLVLISKKDGTYVKDLGSESGTYIDGKKIPTKKMVKWNENQTLKIGIHSIALLATANDDECVQVSAIKGLEGGSAEYMKWMYFILMALTILSTLSEGREGIVAKMFTIINMGLLLTILYFLNKFLMKLITPKNMNVTDIFLGEEGFTAHYDAGANMTLKLSEIEGWKKQMGGSIVKMKNGDVYNFLQLQKREKLVEYLSKNVPKLEVIEKEINSYWYVALGLAIAILVGHFEVVDKMTSEMTFGLILLMFATVAWSMKFSKHKYWMPNNRYMNNKKFAQLGGAICLLVLGIQFLEPEPNEVAKASQGMCSKESKRNCKEINYELLTLKETNYSKAKIACDVGNKSACTRLEKQGEQERFPASVPVTTK